MAVCVSLGELHQQYVPRILNTFSKSVVKFTHLDLSDYLGLVNATFKDSGQAKLFSANSVSETVNQFRARGFVATEGQISAALSGTFVGAAGSVGKLSFNDQSGAVFSFEVSRDEKSGQVSVSQVLDTGLLAPSNEKVLQTMHNKVMENNDMMNQYKLDGESLGLKGSKLDLYMHWRADKTALLLTLDLIVAKRTETAQKFDLTFENGAMHLCTTQECIDLAISKQAEQQESGGKKMTRTAALKIAEAEKGRILSMPANERPQPSKQYAKALGALISYAMDSYSSLLTKSAPSNAFIDPIGTAIADLQTRSSIAFLQDSSEFSTEMAKKKRQEREDRNDGGSTGGTGTA